MSIKLQGQVQVQLYVAGESFSVNWDLQTGVVTTTDNAGLINQDTFKLQDVPMQVSTFLSKIISKVG